MSENQKKSTTGLDKTFLTNAANAGFFNGDIFVADLIL